MIPTELLLAALVIAIATAYIAVKDNVKII